MCIIRSRLHKKCLFFSILEDLDFVFIPAVLTFQPGETMKIVLIPIINDNITEQNETFTLTINVLPQFQPAISIGTIKQTEVIIFDDGEFLPKYVCM